MFYGDDDHTNNDEQFNLNDLLEKAEQEQREKLFDDPEWTTKKWIHIQTLIQAVSVGIISADPYHHNYYLPKNYETVINYYIKKLHEKLKPDINVHGVLQISLVKFEGITKQILMQCPEFLEWNTIGDNKDKIISIDRYTPVPNEKQFMDLGAMIRNTTVYVRDYIRKCEQFDREFEEKYGKND